MRAGAWLWNEIATDQIDTTKAGKLTYLLNVQKGICQAIEEQKTLAGLTERIEKIEANLHNSLMLVTALNPHVGYENAAKIAKKAHKENLTLKEAAVQLGILSESEFDRLVIVRNMVSGL